MKNRQGWLDCIRNYRFHSIFLKNLGLIMGIILLPFVCIVGISTYAYDELQRSEEKAYADEKIAEISGDVENLFNGIREKAFLLNANQDVKLFFYADRIDNDAFYKPENIFNFLSLYGISTEIIDNVYLYAPYSDAVFSPASRVSYEKFDDKECIDRWKDNGEMYQIEYLSREVIGERKDTLSFYYTTRLSTDRTGVIIININMKKLAKELDYGDQVRLEIVGGGKMLYDSTGVRNGSEVESVEALMQASEAEISVSHKLDQFGIEFVTHIENEDLYVRLGHIRKILWTVIILMVIVSALLAFYISQKIFDPISEIMKLLEADTNVNEDVILQNKNELSYISDSIRSTLSRNKSIEEELAARVKLMKKAQAVALQAQINPHFINNTLETINWMAIRQHGGDNDVSEMLNSLSQILRFSLADTDTFVTLQEELEYVKKYLFIQLKRLNQNFDVIWKIPKEHLACKTIKMILQPIVENAINYGIKPYRKRGELEIEVVRVQDILCIRVKDSGLGLKSEAAEEINRSIRKQVIKESNHIGLTNVHQRIILTFGENYGVTVKGEINKGTVVELELPYLM